MAKRKRVINTRDFRVKVLFNSAHPERRGWKPVVSVRGSGAPQSTQRGRKMKIAK